MDKKKAANAPAAEIEKFKVGAQAYMKYISEKWAGLTAYTPKDYDCENSTIFSYWKNEEDEAPVFIFYLDGCKSYKV
jgi:hypothetical protein